MGDKEQPCYDAPCYEEECTDSTHLLILFGRRPAAKALLPLPPPCLLLRAPRRRLQPHRSRGRLALPKRKLHRRHTAPAPTARSTPTRCHPAAATAAAAAFPVPDPALPAGLLRRRALGQELKDLALQGQPLFGVGCCLQLGGQLGQQGVCLGPLCVFQLLGRGRLRALRLPGQRLRPGQLLFLLLRMCGPCCPRRPRPCCSFFA